MERIAVPKRVRFEIFKRDQFQCAYCGRTPPAVILEVDHIVAVSNGGNNDPVNLVTSCFDCNSGKSNTPLAVVPASHLNTINLAREKLDQLRAVTELSLEARREADNLFSQVSTLWLGNSKGDVGIQIRRYLTKLPVGEVMEAIELTNSRLKSKPNCQRLRYFCGVCNHKVRGEVPVRKTWGYP
jgi:hypothetical protein